MAAGTRRRVATAARHTAHARLGTLGRLNYAERRSDSNTVSYLCTVSAAPKLGSASAGASEVSVKTLTLTTPTPPTSTILDRRVRLGTLGRLNYVERRSDSNTVSYLCTIPAAPELGSASAKASEVSVKTHPDTPHNPSHTVLETRAPRNSGAAESRRAPK